MRSATLYVSGDSASVSVGADDLARAIAAEAARRGIEARIVRTGSRGLYFLEPMFELDTEEGRLGFRPAGTMAECVAEMFDAIRAEYGRLDVESARGPARQG